MRPIEMERDQVRPTSNTERDRDTQRETKRPKETERDQETHGKRNTEREQHTEREWSQEHLDAYLALAAIIIGQHDEAAG
jgi:hypothetical protein